MSAESSCPWTPAALTPGHPAEGGCVLIERVIRWIGEAPTSLVSCQTINSLSETSRICTNPNPAAVHSGDFSTGSARPPFRRRTPSYDCAATMLLPSPRVSRSSAHRICRVSATFGGTLCSGPGAQISCLRHGISPRLSNAPRVTRPRLCGARTVRIPRIHGADGKIASVQIPGDLFPDCCPSSARPQGLSSLDVLGATSAVDNGYAGLGNWIYAAMAQRPRNTDAPSSCPLRANGPPSVCRWRPIRCSPSVRIGLPAAYFAALAERRRGRLAISSYPSRRKACPPHRPVRDSKLRFSCRARLDATIPRTPCVPVLRGEPPRPRYFQAWRA